MRDSRVALLLVLAWAAVRLATLPVLPLVDPTEGRYATVAREMLRSGDLVTPTIWRDGEHVPYLGKPPLQFWLMSGSMALLGENEVAARLPGFLAALVLLGIVAVVCSRVFDRRIAARAVLVLASCGGFFLLAGAATLDMTFTLWVAGALLFQLAFLAEARPAAKRRWSLLTFAFLGLAVLTKGPIGLVFFAVPVLAWTVLHRAWGDLAGHAWLPGLALFGVLVVPPYWAVEAANPGFLQYFLWQENVLRFVTSDYGDRYGAGHRTFLGAAALFVVADAAPFSLWLLVERVRGRIRLRPSLPARRRAADFLLAGWLGTTVLLCFGRQVLWTYVLPVVPLLAVHIAVVLDATCRPLRFVARVACVTWFVLAAAHLAVRPSVERGKSTRAVLGAAQERLAQDGRTGRVMLLPSTPNSAYFYGNGSERVLPHSKIDWIDQLRAQVDAGTDDLYALRESAWDEVPSTLRERLRRVGTSGRWLLLYAR